MDLLELLNNLLKRNLRMVYLNIQRIRGLCIIYIFYKKKLDSELLA
jgi:hypothetical protein